MTKNNLSYKSGAKSMLCIVAMKGSSLSSHIFIRTWPCCFALTWYLSATSMCLSVYNNEPRIKSETFVVMWHIDPESKVQLVNYKLSPKFLLGHSSLIDMRAIDAYIFLSLLFLPLSHTRLPFSLKHTSFLRILLSVGGFGHFAIRWYSDPHLFF